MSIRRSMMGVTALGVVSCLACAELVAQHVTATKGLATSYSGTGKSLGPPFGEATQSVIATATAAPAETSATSPMGTYFSNWSARVDEARKSQPHWLPPLMTISPLITQLVRVDGSYQWQGNGARTSQSRWHQRALPSPREDHRSRYRLPKLPGTIWRPAGRRPDGLPVPVGQAAAAQR